jgi:chromosome segregation ATPase
MRRKYSSIAPLKPPCDFSHLALRVPFARIALIVLVAVSIGFSAGAARGQEQPTAQDEPSAQDKVEQMRKTIRQLTAEAERLRSEVERLRRKVAELEKYQLISVLRDRMIKEEERGENLQTQLLTLSEKENALQDRLYEIQEALRSENIDNLGTGGSTRPEQVRDSARRRLTSEQQRVQSQLDQERQVSSRLRSSIAENDLIIQRLRSQIQQSLRP